MRGSWAPMTWTSVPKGGNDAFWGATLYFDLASPPTGTVRVVARHVEGQASRTARPKSTSCTSPRRDPFRLTMISQDVIRRFFAPAFRVKMKIPAGRYTTA